MLLTIQNCSMIRKVRKEGPAWSPCLNSNSNQGSILDRFYEPEKFPAPFYGKFANFSRILANLSYKLSKSQVLKGSQKPVFCIK